MHNPSRTDCIAILSAASRVGEADSLLALDHTHLGLSRNAMVRGRVSDRARLFQSLYLRHPGFAVGALSLQGRMRLDQLSNG